MARESLLPEDIDDETVGNHLEAADKDTIAKSAKREKKKKKKKPTQDEANTDDAEDPKVNSERKKRKKDRSEKATSSKEKKHGSSKKKRKRSELKSNGDSFADVKEQAGTADGSVKLSNRTERIDGFSVVTEAAPVDGEVEVPKKKKRKREKERDSSKQDCHPLEMTESGDVKSKVSKKRKKKKEKKKRKESSDGEEERNIPQGEGGSVNAGTSDEALRGMANGDAGKLSDTDGPTGKQNSKHSGRAVKMEPETLTRDYEHPQQEEATGSMPDVSDILTRASQKRNGYLHGLTALPLLCAEQVRALDKNGKHEYIKKSAGLCHRLVHLMHKIVVTANQWVKVERRGDFVDIEEALTTEMARLKMFPLARQYVSMTLWQRIQQMTRDHLHASSKIGFGKGYAESNGGDDQGLVLHREGDPDAEFVSYRDAYMTDLVERHQSSLETLREREQMDETRVRYLLRCLGAGSSLAANLKCIEKNMKGEEAVSRKT